MLSLIMQEVVYAAFSVSKLNCHQKVFAGELNIHGPHAAGDLAWTL